MRQKFPVGVNSDRSAGGGIVLVVVEVVDVVVGMLVVVDVVVCVTVTPRSRRWLRAAAERERSQQNASHQNHVRIRKSPLLAARCLTCHHSSGRLSQSMPTTGVNRA